jgi:hypothetical protein
VTQFAAPPASTQSSALEQPIADLLSTVGEFPSPDHRIAPTGKGSHQRQSSCFTTRINFQAYRLTLAATSILQHDGERRPPVNGSPPTFKQPPSPGWMTGHQRF